MPPRRYYIHVYSAPVIRHTFECRGSLLRFITVSGYPSHVRTVLTVRALQAIRKKIESELSRKRTISTTQQLAPGSRRRGHKASAQKGTVAALKPSPALTVPENITVSEASQLCAAKRTDCVLVVDDDEGLSGIFTAKDLAYRVRVVFAMQFSGTATRRSRSPPRVWTPILRKLALS